MKILVTGRRGQLAVALVDAASKFGARVILAGRPEMDLCEPRSVKTAIARYRPDLVVNAAAYTQVDLAETDATAAYAVNADGASHVAQACNAQDVPLIHISTDYVFDGAKKLPYVEGDPTAPLNVYGRSKRDGERRIAAECREHLILRTSWVFSDSGRNFVRTMLRAAETQRVLRVVDDQIGCPTYAPHLAEAILSMACRVITDPAIVPWGVYHAAGQGSTSWCGFASEVFRIAPNFGWSFADVTPVTTADYPTVARRPANSRLDCSAIQAAFDIRLPDWQSGVYACLTLLERSREL